MGISNDDAIFREMEAAVDDAVRKYHLTAKERERMLRRMIEKKNYNDVEAAAAVIVLER